jgi:hypothetical protein
MSQNRWLGRSLIRVLTDMERYSVSTRLLDRRRQNSETSFKMLLNRKTISLTLSLKSAEQLDFIGF